MFDVTSRRVCKPCNNGWMSDLEVAANPILRRLIAGERTLTADESCTVLRWLAKTAVVSHFAEPDSDNPPAVAQPDRTTILEGRIPAGWRFLLGTLDPSWRHHRHRGVVRAPKSRVVHGERITEIYHFASLEIGCFIGCVIGCPPDSDAGPLVTEYLAGGMQHCYPFFEHVTGATNVGLSRTGTPPSENSLNELAVTFVDGLARLRE